MTSRRVLLAATVEAGKQLVRERPELADVRVVTPRMYRSLEGQSVTEILVVDGASAVPRFTRAYAVLERNRRKTVAKLYGRLGWRGQCSCCNGPKDNKAIRADENRAWRRDADGEVLDWAGSDPVRAELVRRAALAGGNTAGVTGNRLYHP